MPLDSETYAAALKKAKAYTDSMIHRGILVGQVTNGGSFPTTRPDGSALQDEDYCTPLASSTFPFTIGTVTFDNRFTQAVYFSGTWLSNPGAIQDTSETPLKNPSAEGITGLEQTQAQLNISMKTNKVDKSTDTTHSLVYARIAGAETTMEAATGAAIDTLALRTSDGRIKAADPAAGEDVATKDYVDAAAKPDNVTLDRNGSGELEVKDAGIVTAKLATDAVETLKIKDANVTTAKLADASVTAVKIATDAVETAKIKDDNVTIAKIADANICEVIPFSGAGNSKLTTEKAVVDYVSNGGVNTYTYDNTSEQFELEYVTPDGTSTTKTITAASITKGVVTQTAAQALSNKTIDVDNNTVSNIEVDNLKAGVLDTASFTVVDDTHIPSSKLVDAKIKDAVSAIIKFVGYVAPTAPAGSGIKVGSYWYQSSSSDMPTTFPISVKTYDGTAWSTTSTTYTPAEWEAWINKNTNKEYYYSGGTWNQIDFTVAADNLTINKNVSGELQIKDHGITLVKFESKTAADAGKGYLIDSTGNTIIDQIKQYKRVTALTTEVGNSYTMYVLDTPEATYAAGIYVWDAVNGFVNYNGGGSTGPQFIGLVTNGDTFPIIRPDGTALQLGDYVKPSSASTFPFTIDSCTFTSPRDQATYLGYMNWQLNASPYQSTIDVSVNDATTESLSGTSLFQNNINTENVTAIKERVKALDIPVRENTRSYALNARVLYPEKYGYVCVAATAGTTAASKPAWPTGGIISGVTTFNDGSVQWKVYDAIEGGVKKEDIALRENSTAYAVNARAMYPGKSSFCLICTTAGTSAGSLPAWPATISSGSTTLSDGTATWTIYDMSLGGVPQLSTFPTATSTSPVSFQYIGNDGTHEQFAFYKKVNVAIYHFTSASYGGYTDTLPPADGTRIQLYLDAAFSYPSLYVAYQSSGNYYLDYVAMPGSQEPGTYTTSTSLSYKQMFKAVSVSDINVGTDTEPGIVSPAVLHKVIPNIAVRENSTAYAIGDRVLYPGKSGYVLVCETAGTTAATIPAWPASTTTGSTLTDGTVVWAITDIVNCIPQLTDFPTVSATSPVSFQYIGTSLSYEQFAIYSKTQGAPFHAVSTSYSGYVPVLPTPSTDEQVYSDSACTSAITGLWLQDDGGGYSLFDSISVVSESATTTPTVAYTKGWPRQMTAADLSSGTDTTGKLISPKLLSDTFDDKQRKIFYQPTAPDPLLDFVHKGDLWMKEVGGTEVKHNGTVVSSPLFYKDNGCPAGFIDSWGIHGDVNLPWGSVPDSIVQEIVNYGLIVECSFADRWFGRYAVDGWDWQTTFTQTVTTSSSNLYIYNDSPYPGQWVQATPTVDDSTIDFNVSGNLEVKDGGITPAKLANQSTSLADYVYTVKSDGTTYLAYPNSFVEVATFTGVTGKAKTLYWLTTDITGYNAGLYRYNGSDFVKVIEENDDIGMRKNSTAYIGGARVKYPGKPGYVLVCKTAGTSASSVPSFPWTVVSGTTTLTDGTVTWVIHDQTQAVIQEPDGGATARTKDSVWRKRGPTSSFKVIPTVKFNSYESPTGSNQAVFCIELWNSSSDAWGTMTARLGGNIWQCACSGEGNFGDWNKMVVKSELQTFYDGIFPVGFVHYGATAPGVPAGITATWAEDTSVNARYLQVSSDAAGTLRDEQLPNISGYAVGDRLGNGYTPAGGGALSISGWNVPSGWGQRGSGYDGSVTTLSQVNFNAHSSNATYVDNGRVQPYTVTIKKWVRTA